MMWSVSVTIKVLLIPLTWSKTPGVFSHPESDLNFIERSNLYGYNADEHTVQTYDDYILTLFRMRRGEKCFGEPRPPLLLMHGLFMTSDSWLDAGPGSSLAYLLSDACCDLWVGNVRGNFYGKRHLHLNPKTDHNFWDFSVDEIGMYDVPATIDYVLKYTGWDKLDYIGYSQGGGSLIIMCSEKPIYCSKLRTFIALAPATQTFHSKSKVTKALFILMEVLDRTLGRFSFMEILPKGGIAQTLLSNICEYEALQDIICKPVLSAIDSYHAGSIKSDTWKVIYKNLPSGTSVRNLARYGQSLRSEGFRKFDFGRIKNLQIYGVPHAPYYNISAVNVSTVIIYGRNDHLIVPEDINWLTRSLPNLLELKEVVDSSWNHLDFAYSQYIKEMVFPTVIKYLLRDVDDYNKNFNVKIKNKKHKP